MRKLLTEPLADFLLFGQVLFVAALVTVFFTLRPALVRLLRSAEENRVHWSSLAVPASYATGAVASYRMIDRVTGFWI